MYTHLTLYFATALDYIVIARHTHRQGLTGFKDVHVCEVAIACSKVNSTQTPSCLGDKHLGNKNIFKAAYIHVGLTVIMKQLACSKVNSTPSYLKDQHLDNYLLVLQPYSYSEVASLL